MARARSLKLDSATRQALLRIAGRHFARYGFERASLNAILSEAGVSKGSYYYCFDDKEDLFATVLEDAFTSLTATLPLPDFAALEPRQFWPTVEGFVATWAASFDVSSDVFQAALKLGEAQRRSPRFAPVLARAHELYRTLIEAGQALGCVRSDLSVKTLVRLLEANDAVLDAIYVESGEKVSTKSVAKHAALVFDTFKRLLAANGLPERRRRRA